MAAIALLVFYSNYMVAPLIPALSREFAVRPDALDWLVAWSLHNTAKSGNQILDEHLATVCLLRNEKICAINTYLSDVEMVNACFV
jgi:hypothetical protein